MPIIKIDEQNYDLDPVLKGPGSINCAILFGLIPRGARNANN